MLLKFGNKSIQKSLIFSSKANDARCLLIILDSAVQDAKAMQGFELESLLMGAEHSQKVKAAPIKNDYSSKNCVALASSTAESRIKHLARYLLNRGFLKDFLQQQTILLR